MYKKVNQKQSFPKLEEEVLKFWNENKIFEKSVDFRKDSSEFNFYDGPPFATGTPHYGHILAGTIKDVVPRYQTMKGHKVKRVFGWDCHGLPIENIVEKKLNISGKDDIENKVGIHDFNEQCRANVLTYTDEWKKVVARTGRWVDMENAYHTMDNDFMESVWWVFKSVYDKGLIYEGNRVVPYCPRCTTPLSNFEVNQGYKDKQSKTVTVKFKVKGNDNKYILAWTTTPWTLYSNLGLAVGKDIIYAEIKDKVSGDTYVLAKDRLSSYYKNEDDYTLVREYPGSCLIGLKYEALFPDIKTKIEDMGEDLGVGIELGENAYSVVEGHHVTTESGTGIVHIAPAYGEDDNLIGKNEKLGFIAHIGDDGKTCNLIDKNEKFVFDFNEEVIDEIKDLKHHVHIGTIDHSYPHCWRCDTPLIYRGISAWYVAVEKIRDKMVANNEKINWVPEVIKHGRFGKWIENARDWNISRNRYWGSAMPVWQSEDKKQEVCVGSIEELYELNKDFGQIEEKDGKYFYTSTNKEVDIHKHFVDEIKLKHPETGVELTRIPEVLDCWFESGAMPYASKHYMGEKKYNFKNNFYISRHGIAENNDIGIESCNIETQKKYGLTKLGLENTKKEAKKYKNSFDLIVCSPFRRTQETAAEYSKTNGKCEVIIDDRLVDVNVGIYDEKPYSDSQLFENNNNPVVTNYPEGENYKDVEKRMLEVVKEYNEKYEGKNILLVSHGGALQTLMDSLKYGEPKKHVSLIDKSTVVYLNEIQKDYFKFPADFIAEGLDQTRGWFYTLLILGTALFDNTPFLNCIVNGIVLAEDGKKMSKSLQNYPDPNHILDKYGADAMRFYLMNSPVVAADDFRFAESGVEEVVKKVILPLWNTYSFFTTYANIDKFEISGNTTRNNNLDKWLISELNELTKQITNGLDSYKLNEAARPIVKFMDNLTNWYIRRSRKRFWKSENDNDKLEAYETLHYTLVELTKLIAPFMPFVSESIFKNLTGKESVHLEDFPNYNESLIDEKLNLDTDKVQKIITLGLAWRANNKIRVRQPLSSITVTEKLDDYYEEIIKEELNVKEVLVVDGNSLAKQVCKPNGRLIGPKFGKDVKFIMSEAKSGNFELLDNGNVKVGDFELEDGDFELVFESGESKALIEAGFGMVIAMDENITEELKLEGYARDIVRQIQEARKEATYEVDDRIQVHLSGAKKVLKSFKEYIETETLSTISDINSGDLEKDIELEDLRIKLILKK